MQEASQLDVHSISQSYGASIALDNVSFQISSDQALGYIGTNGSGKSTTVKLLLGLTRPTSGKILFNGRDIYSDLKFWRSRIGYVPELPSVYPYLSGLEHLQLVGRLRSMPEREVRQKASELMRLFSLWEYRDVPLASYSKGMKQRVLISAALLHNPDVLILDEPLSGLDALSALIVKQLLITLRPGRCVLYCSHSLENVATVCTHAAVLQKGRRIGYGTIAAVREQLKELSGLTDVARSTAQENTEKIAQQIISVISDRQRREIKRC